MNNWRLKNGGSVTNREDFERLDRLNAQLDVVWVSACTCLLVLTQTGRRDEFITSAVFQMHIPGHAGYHGNEQADRLSREGAAKSDVQQGNN